MEQKKRIDPTFHVWVDMSSHVISFQRVEGFERFSFSSREKMLAYVFEMGTSGYRIQ